jgi:hypothetical protein
MGGLWFAVVLIAVAVAFFVASVRVGMLLGRLMDRRLYDEPRVYARTDDGTDSPEEDPSE